MAMKRTRNLLLIIDMQNDFCHPEGALFVPGAVEDVQRTAEFIRKNSQNIDQVVMTQDNHHPLDIAHPGFWRNAEGEQPQPFSQITAQEVENGSWQPMLEPEKVLNYLKALYDKQEYPHTIWPEHCLIGSWGAAMKDEVMQAVADWARQGNYYQMVTKGRYPFSEHFGALRANIPDPQVPETEMNQSLVKTLQAYDHVYIAGEAKSHCVANTLKQLLDLQLGSQLHLLQDTMSDVPGLGHLGEPIYKKAKQQGVKFETSEVEIE